MPHAGPLFQSHPAGDGLRLCVCRVQLQLLRRRSVARRHRSDRRRHRSDKSEPQSEPEPRQEPTGFVLDGLQLFHLCQRQLLHFRQLLLHLPVDVDLGRPETNSKFFGWIGVRDSKPRPRDEWQPAEPPPARRPESESGWLVNLVQRGFNIRTPTSLLARIIGSVSSPLRIILASGKV